MVLGKGARQRTGHERGIQKSTHKELLARSQVLRGYTWQGTPGGYMYHILWHTLGVAQDASDHQDENTF